MFGPWRFCRQFCIICSVDGMADYLQLALNRGERSKLSIYVNVRFFAMLDSWSFVCSWCMLTLTCFQRSPKPVGSILPSAGRRTRRTGSGQRNFKQRYIYLICTPGNWNPWCRAHHKHFSIQKLPLLIFSSLGLRVMDLVNQAKMDWFIAKSWSESYWTKT